MKTTLPPSTTLPLPITFGWVATEAARAKQARRLLKEFRETGDNAPKSKA